MVGEGKLAARSESTAGLHVELGAVLSCGASAHHVAVTNVGRARNGDLYVVEVILAFGVGINVVVGNNALGEVVKTHPSQVTGPHGSPSWALTIETSADWGGPIYLTCCTVPRTPVKMAMKTRIAGERICNILLVADSC